MLKLDEIAARLTAAFPELHPSSLPPLAQVIAALTSGTQAKLHSDKLLDQEIFEYLTGFISTHHALSNRPLKKENFEHAIEHIFRRQGKEVPQTTDPTRRGADIMVDGVRYSLKTCSTSGPRLPNTVDISKFAESRWLREPLLDEDFSTILSLCKESVRTHLAEYDDILMLHNHSTIQDDKPVVLYRLYKMPKSIFEAVYDLDETSLAKMYLQGKNKRTRRNPEANAPQTITAPIYIDQNLIAKMSLDGSVEKLRFLSVSLDACSIQSEWTVTTTTQGD